MLFNMADSTQLTVIDRVLGFLFAIAPEVIYFAPDKEALARDFKKVSSGFSFFLAIWNLKVCCKKYLIKKISTGCNEKVINQSLTQ